MSSLMRRGSYWGWVVGLLLRGLPAFATLGAAPAPITYHFQEKPSFSARWQAFWTRRVAKPAVESRAAFEEGRLYLLPEEVATPPAFPRKLLTLRVTQSGQRQVFTLVPARAAAPKVVLYLHGGAYVHTFRKSHWRFLAEVVAQTGYTVVAPDYPLAPHHTYLEAFALVEPLYRELVAQVGATNVIVMGDGAGGGFALALAEKLRQDHVARPAQLILLAPWLDAALENPAIEQVQPTDPVLNRTALRYSAEAYAGKTPLPNYQLSPLYGDLTGLPQISLFTSTHDILNPDAQRLKQRLAAQGIPLNFFEYEQLMHNWILRKMPEARKARKQISSLLKS